MSQVSRKRNLVPDPDEAETPETEEPEEEEIATDLPDADETPKPETNALPEEQPINNWADEVRPGE